ncbi:hypothetical protein CANARDRAFT_180263, partial [[Candida] arabinofermentans NRRL YB-2248]
QTSNFYKIPTDEKSMISKPWRQDPYHFHTVHISILALIKMTIHARSGGSIEIMGMMIGKIYDSGDMIIMDSYPLPVQGTESRVNPLNESYEFMLNYLQDLKKLNFKNEDIIGWYHSHPGFGCWLSGVDIKTQELNQNFQDPYVAVVIDPERTLQQGIVEIGAFRTFYNDNKPSKTKTNSNKDKPIGISSSKLKDYGYHADDYYSLKIKIFKNTIDDKILNLIKSENWLNGLLHNNNSADIDNSNKIENLSNLIKNQKPNPIKLNQLPLSSSST